MKKPKILLGLGAVTLLASCGPKLITDTAEINDLKDAIVLKKNEVKNYMFSGSGKQVEIDKKTKKETTRVDEMFLRVNEKGEEQAHTTYQSGSIVEDYYLVNDETYDKLIYCDSDSRYDGKITVIDQKTHKNEFDEVLADELEPITSAVDTLLDPYKILSVVGLFHNDGQTFDTVTKYYSEKDGQLTVKINETSTVKGDNTTNEIEINYEDYVFKGMSMKHAYSTEEIETKFEFNFDFKKLESLTISLPTVWESHLIKDN